MSSRRTASSRQQCRHTASICSQAGSTVRLERGLTFDANTVWTVTYSCGMLSKDPKLSSLKIRILIASLDESFLLTLSERFHSPIAFLLSGKSVCLKLKFFLSSHCFPPPSKGEYYAKLIRSLELHAGYKRNKDIFGAPCKSPFRSSSGRGLPTFSDDSSGEPFCGRAARPSIELG